MISVRYTSSDNRVAQIIFGTRVFLVPQTDSLLRSRRLRSSRNGRLHLAKLREIRVTSAASPEVMWHPFTLRKYVSCGRVFVENIARTTMLNCRLPVLLKNPWTRWKVCKFLASFHPGTKKNHEYASHLRLCTVQSSQLDKLALPLPSSLPVKNCWSVNSRTQDSTKSLTSHYIKGVM